MSEFDPEFDQQLLQPKPLIVAAGLPSCGDELSRIPKAINAVSKVLAPIPIKLSKNKLGKLQLIAFVNWIAFFVVEHHKEGIRMNETDFVIDVQSSKVQATLVSNPLSIKISFLVASDEI